MMRQRLYQFFVDQYTYWLFTTSPADKNHCQGVQTRAGHHPERLPWRAQEPGAPSAGCGKARLALWQGARRVIAGYCAKPVVPRRLLVDICPTSCQLKCPNLLASDNFRDATSRAAFDVLHFGGNMGQLYSTIVGLAPPMRYIRNPGHDVFVKVGIFKNPRIIYELDETYKTWLHRYAELGDPECLRLILEAHANNGSPDLPGCPNYVDCRDKLGRTAIHYAAMSGVSACVELLLENKANPEMADYDHKRPRNLVGDGCDSGPYGFPVDIKACIRLLPPHELA